MGALSDKAKQQSNFLIIEKGHYAVVRFESYRFIPSQLDPNKEVVQYRLIEDGLVKFWTNGSGRIMLFMDKVQPGQWLRIHRRKMISDSGVEDSNKSRYDIYLCDSMGVITPEGETNA